MKKMMRISGVVGMLGFLVMMLLTPNVAIAKTVAEYEADLKSISADIKYTTKMLVIVCDDEWGSGTEDDVACQYYAGEKDRLDDKFRRTLSAYYYTKYLASELVSE